MRRNFTQKLLCLLLLACGIASCDISDLKDAIIVPEVENEFYVDLWEDLSAPGGKVLLVKVESIKTEKCLNYRIDQQFTKTNNQLKIVLNNIIKPLDCVVGEATVKADVNIGDLPSGFYQLNMDLKNTITNEGYLAVENDRYEWDLNTKNGIKPRRKELLRVPENAIWGYVTYTQATDEATANQFVQDLKNISEVPIHYLTGYYGHFVINAADSKVTIHEQPAIAKPFLYNYKSEEEKLKNILSNYRRNYANRLTIKLYNGKGQEL